MRPLPDDYAFHLDPLVLLRHLQLVVWILERRREAAFRRRWQRWAREELDAITARVAAD